MSCQLFVENINLKGKEPPFLQTLDCIGIHPREPREIIVISDSGTQFCLYIRISWEVFKNPFPTDKSKSESLGVEVGLAETKY